MGLEYLAKPENSPRYNYYFNKLGVIFPVCKLRLL